MLYNVLLLQRALNDNVFAAVLHRQFCTDEEAL